MSFCKLNFSTYEFSDLSNFHLFIVSILLCFRIKKDMRIPFFHNSIDHDDFRVSVRICENRDPSCRCYGHRIEDMAEPRQSGRPEYELLPQDDMFFFEPVLDTELPGVHYDTLKDMVTVLHAVRTPALTLADDLDKYLEDFYTKGR